MQDFFTRLKEERESSGVNLDEIHQITRISLEYLNAIENGELKKLPKGYDRIFMKSYLQAFGADVDVLLEDFDRLLGRREPTQVIDLELLERDKQKREININNRVKYVLLWMPVILILSFLIYLFLSFGNDNGQTDEADSNIPEIKVEDYISDIDTVQSALAVPVIESADSIFLSLRGLKRTWVRSIVDRRDTMEFTLSGNVVKNLEADSIITFVIGVGNGLTIQHRDSLYENIAPAGQVIKRLVFDRNGIRELIHALPAANTSGQ